MKALVYHGKEDIRIEDVEEPKIVKGRVKVAPKFCGICGSDLHEYLGGPTMSAATEHPITGEKVPLTFGHEFAGVVEEVGEGVTKFKKGDRVCVEPIIWDDSCTACKLGRHNACVNGGFIGLSGWGGGLSEHCVIPEDSLYHLPDNVSYEVGALVEPLAVGWHAVKSSPLKKGDYALVLGSGPIGLATVQALVATKKANKIIVQETAEKRKEFAKLFGATHIVDPSKEDSVKTIMELTDGDGPQVIFDAAGIQGALDQAVQMIRVGGTIVNIAIWEKPCTIDPIPMLKKEAFYRGIITYARGEFQEVLDAISSGAMPNPQDMITKVIELKDIVDDGFGALINDKANQVKILVKPPGGD